MKELKKKAIIAALIMIAVGFAISIYAMGMMNFNLKSINTISFVTNTYTVDKAFSNISIDGAECIVRMLPSQDDSCKIVCYEGNRIYHSVTVHNDTLTIERHDNRKWYEHFGIYWGSMEIRIYLPESEFTSLYANSLSGDIVIPEGFSFETAKVQSISGNVNFCASVSKDLSVKTVSGELYVGEVAPDKLAVQSISGDITIENTQVQTDITLKAVSGDIELFRANGQSITADTTSGGIDFFDVTATRSIHIESVSGDIELNSCDADSLWIKSSSGDVSGILLTEKIFLTNTSSGEVDVPHTASGGRCEITTTSGDIEFAIQ